MRQSLLTTTLVLVVACSGEHTASGAWHAERDTVGDTIIVRTVSGSAWGAPRRLVERATVGKAEGEDYDLLGGFRAIAVAPDGSVYISDDGPVLRKYAPDGHFLATFGRKGRGPGEYAQPDGGLAVLSDGRVLIRDPGNARMTVFDSAGKYLTAWRIRAGSWHSRQSVVDTAENVYVPIAVDPDSAIEKRRAALEQYHNDGTPGDTLIVPEWDTKPATVTGASGESSMTYGVPFAPDAVWTFSPLGYFVGGLGDQYRVTLFRPGEPLILGRDVPAVAVLADEAADAKQKIVNRMRKAFGNWSWNGPDVPDTKPLFKEIFAGDDGRLWIQLSQPGHPEEADDPSDPSEWKEPVVLDVFEPDGRYLGQVAAPEGFLQYPSPVFRGDTVWAGFEDVDGVRYVKRFELSTVTAR